MADTSDPELLRAVASVRSDATPQTYCVLGAGKKKLSVVAIGTDRSPFAASVNEMDDGQVSFALLRVANTRDQESKTVKFVFVTCMHHWLEPAEL